jgi:hypothetical protein
LRNRLKLTVIKYLKNCTLPLRGEAVKTMNRINKNPVGKLTKNANRKAAICGLNTMKERSRFCFSRIKL